MSEEKEVDIEKVKTVRICVSCIKYVKERRKVFCSTLLWECRVGIHKNQICVKLGHICHGTVNFIELEMIHVKKKSCFDLLIHTGGAKDCLLIKRPGYWVKPSTIQVLRECNQ